MPQPIQVPQTTPNAPQFQPPTDLVNAYLNRQQQGQQFAVGQVANLAEYLNQLKQQKITNQLATLGAVAQLYGAGGPRAVKNYAPQLSQMGGSSMVPQTSQPAQMPTPPQNPPPTAGTAQPSSGPQDQTPSPFIQASLQAGHPDIAGVGSFHAPQAQPPVTAGTPNALGQSQAWNAPQPTPEDLADIQSGGTYGRNKAQSYMDLGNMAMQPLTATEKQASIRAQNAKFATPEQGAAIASGDPAAVAGAYGGTAPVEAYNNAAQKQMEVKKTIAGEVSKQSQDTQNINQLKTLAGNLGTALQGHNPGILGNQAGSLYQVSGGRVGSSSAAAIQNAANPLATALNTELARRFNSGEVALLSQSLIPQPKDTPQYAQQKLQNLNRLIDSMASGNETNVKNVAAAITSGAIPSIGKKPNQETSNNPKVHNAAVEWAKANPNDPRAKAVLAKAQASLGVQ